MATPVGTILCVGMLGLSAVILIVATIASAFVVIPLEAGPSTTVRLKPGVPSQTGGRHFSIAV
jgi:hypothetical protein